MPARLLSLLLALALMVPATALGTVWHLCRTMGAVSEDCCCAHGQADQAQQVEIRADCCELPSASSAPSAAAVLPQLFSVPAVLPAPLDGLFVGAFVAPSAPGFAPARARGPPKRVPRFLENCSLLT